MEEILAREELLDDAPAADGTREVTLAREVRREGRSICRLNGRAAVSLIVQKQEGDHPGKLQPEELPKVEIEISVLTPPRAVGSYLDIVIGRHGMILSKQGLMHGYVWQLLTFQFLHAGWLHLIFNGLAIYFFGRSVEYVLGRSRWLRLYFASGVLGVIGLFWYQRRRLIRSVRWRRASRRSA